MSFSFFFLLFYRKLCCAYVTTLIFFCIIMVIIIICTSIFTELKNESYMQHPPDTLFINFVNCSCYEEIAQHANLLIIIRIWRRKGSSLPSLFNLQPPHAHQLSLFLSLALSLSRSTGLSLCPFNLGVLLVTDFVFYTTIQLMCYTFIYIHATKKTHTYTLIYLLREYFCCVFENMGDDKRYIYNIIVHRVYLYRQRKVKQNRTSTICPHR